MQDISLKYLKFPFKGNFVFVMKDHPVAIKCWKDSLQEGLISANAVLFHIDQHPDGSFNEGNMIQSQKILSMSETDLDNFIQQDLNKDNSEFIINSMIAGLISDVISVHYSSRSIYGELIRGNSRKTDRHKFSHNGIEYNFFIYESENISRLFAQRHSLLGDPVIHRDVQELYFNTNNLILDIDLDYFTYFNDGTFAKNKRDIKRQITSRSFKELLSKARVITIALEPTMYNSMEDCTDILE